MESVKDINIRHFKLTSGEDIICYVQSSDENAYIVERPAVVLLSQAGVWTFGDWFPFSDSKVFKIMKRFVINHVPVVTETKESFIRYSLQNDTKQINYEVDAESPDIKPIEDPYGLFDADLDSDIKPKTIH